MNSPPSFSFSSTNTTCRHFVTGQNICLPSSPEPFYVVHDASLISGIPDHALALIAPIVAYWVFSLYFHMLDMSGWKWLDKYRIHESAEVTSRNLASRMDVVVAVIVQHTIQTIMGIFWMTESTVSTPVTRRADMEVIARKLVDFTRLVMDDRSTRNFLDSRGADIVYWVYWWGIPIAQFFFAMFVMDTWQYALHRSMHMNKWLYKQIHSVHHRLYVPYAFGALYNHPLEGFLLDTLGAVISEACAGLSTRQAILFFVVSTCKTIDDHCGYSFPFDPFQMMSGNNADYHDIHHQIIGIKSNFSQPFFVHWDAILGTRMTRKDIAVRRSKSSKSD